MLYSIKRIIFLREKSDKKMDKMVFMLLTYLGNNQMK